MPKDQTEKESEKKLVTRVSRETYEALRVFSEGESRWEARVLRRVIKEWLASQTQAQGFSSHHDILTDDLRRQIAEEDRLRKKRA